MKKISHQQAADELHELIRDCGADELAAIYENAFGAVENCEESDEGDYLIIYYHEGLEE
ncbi:hypothetical protein LCGC14_0142950 [marine sediment metagenome]|uniref:Uncharacterized protein n=1 Tax=marine sediment metagenome TaxID=412755 RepID=A0A0F9V1C0_9ZZZZ